MSVVAAVRTKVPDTIYSREEITAQAREWLASHPSEQTLFERFLGSCQIAQRPFVLPLHQIVELQGQESRAELFQKFGRGLALGAAEEALCNASASASEIDALIFSSCTCPLVPSMDTVLMNQLQLKPETLRVPMYQHGCVGGAVGLSLAHQFAQLGKTSLVAALEICSLGFRGDDLTGGNLVGSAIFADGAAGAIVSPRGAGLRIISTKSLLIPESEYLMGYDIRDDGSHLRLDKELPAQLARCAKRALPDFLSENQLRPEDVMWWLIHPGGVRILELLRDEFNLRDEQLQFSWSVLNSYGNMSSASILFVLAEFMASGVVQAKEYAVGLGVGPGLTVQLILFQRD